MDRATAIRIVTNRLRPLVSSPHRTAQDCLYQRARDLLIEILPYRHGFTSRELDDLAYECVAREAPATVTVG